jgi:uncharacterized protein with FMN-binding domain
MNDEIERPKADVNSERKTAAPMKAAVKESRGRKITRRLVVASAAAILTVYVAGYAATQSAAAQLAGTPASPVAVAPLVTSDGSPTATSVSAASTTSIYKDGTYTGTGSSRHGSIQATVVIQNGKIFSAQISGSTTRYPTSRISSLPGEVVSAQSPNVNYISGATDSSTAYLQAVANALAQAA